MSRLYVNDYLVDMHRVFVSNVGRPSSVLYPGCGFDFSPSRVYDDIVFVDSEQGNTGCISQLVEKGAKAYKVGISSYCPGQVFDMLFLQNPGFRTADAAVHIGEGALILANDGHKNASEMNAHPESYSFVGSITAGVFSMDHAGLFSPANSLDELTDLVEQNVYRALVSFGYYDFEGLCRQFGPIFRTKAEYYVFRKK